LNKEDLIVGESATAKANDVDAAVYDGVASYQDVGGNVLSNARASLYHYVPGDAGELVYQAASAYDSMVVYLHLAGYLSGIAYNNIVFKQTIVSHMAIGHNQAIITDDGTPFGGCASVYRYTFSDGCMVTNLGCGNFAHKLQVLGNTGNDGSGKNTAIVTNPCTVENDDMGKYMTIVTNNYIFFDHGERVDNYILPDLCIGMNNC
jgi:hypothetical protein